MKRRWFVLMALLMTLTPIVSACGGLGDESEQAWTLAPESALPEFVRSAPPQVKEAYRFAIANPEVLNAFPCYCGCGAVGHKSNLECYVKEVGSDGAITFDNHAFG